MPDHKSNCRRPEVDMSGYYDESGQHICEWCGNPTRYQILSGGEDFWCPTCKQNGPYPKGEGGPRARMFTEPDGPLKLRRMMYEELAKRKGDK